MLLSSTLQQARKQVVLLHVNIQQLASYNVHSTKLQCTFYPHKIHHQQMKVNNNIFLYTISYYTNAPINVMPAGEGGGGAGHGVGI